MEIGIIGAGSLGLLYSFYLSQNHTITVYTNRKQQANLINTEGISFIKEGTRSKVFLNADSERNYKEQLLIVTVKQYDIESIIDSLKNLSPRTILFLQNGMGHLRYLSSISKHNIILGIAEHGALRIDDHTVKHTGVGVTKISYYNRDNYSNTGIDQLLAKQHPFFAIEVKDDWEKMLTEKLIANATINPLTAVLKVKNGVLIDNHHFKQLFYELFTEVIHVLELPNKLELWEHVQNICKNTAQNESSMLKDIQRGNQTEIDSILGYIIQKANKNHSQIPHITFLYLSIKGIELSLGGHDD